MIRNLQCMFAVAKSEYIRWITNPRMIIMGILIVFMRTLAVEPLMERAVKMGLPLNRMEPFIAVGNSGMLVMLMPCVFLVFISDYPKMTGNTLLLVQRSGRWNWLAGQLLFLLWTVLTFLGLVFLGCLCVSEGDFLENWSNVVTKYNAVYPNEIGSFASQLLPSNLYNQISLGKALLFTLLLMGAYLFLLGLVLLFCKQLHPGTFGLFTVLLVVASGVVTCSLRMKLMWAFPMANAIVWLHYDVILEKPNQPMWVSFLYFACCIVVLLVCNLWATGRLMFVNSEQVE